MTDKKLADHIEVESHIICSGCQTIGTEYGVDEYLAEDILYDKGWRAGRSNVYCPVCAPKKLKKKENK